MGGYKHKTLIQIRFKDTDKLGHVNNANYLTYFELARMKYAREVIGEINWKKWGFILAKISIEYIQPVFLEEEIYVYTKCSRLGNKSFDLSHSIVKVKDEKEIEVAKGVAVIVCYDYEKNDSMLIPENWRGLMQRFESN